MPALSLARPLRPAILSMLLLSFTLGIPVRPAEALVQSRPASPAPAARSAAPMASEKDLANTQEELLKLLRESPTLTTVVEHDPSLLANQDYVQRNNPQLAQFLVSHPEIPLNPDYYLFTNLNEGGGSRERALERAVWPEHNQPDRPRPLLEILINDAAPFVIFGCITGAILWLVRVFLENRRWNRIFKLQMDVHGRLIDKFATNQELLAYMDTEAGKRFLEAAPLPVNFDAGPELTPRVPSAITRVLNPLQIGIVLTLLGIGFLVMRHASRELNIPMLVLGTLVLMPGLGFIISAGITWLLADRLGLMPDPSVHPGPAIHPAIDRRDRQ